MSDEIRTDAIVTLRHAAEVNNAEATRCRADADKMQDDVNELRARAGWFTAMADRWDRIATFIENGTFDLDYLLSGDDLDEARRAGAAQDAQDDDAATEAFVDVADAERYAQRDEYVNSTGPRPEVALTVRDQAIGCITEKLRELARIENALHANHARATKELGGMSYQTYSDHREAAELNYVTADYYELLVEAITSGSLFDELDKQFPRDEPMPGGES